MIIVPDTNVYISSLIAPQGNPAYIYRAWKDRRVTFALSDPILTEVKDVLGYEHVQQKLDWSPQKIERFLRSLRSRGTMVSAVPTVFAVAADPTDNKFLACAVAAKADAIVTGDAKHLLPLQSFNGIPIITPQQCVEQLQRLTKQAA